MTNPELTPRVKRSQTKPVLVDVRRARSNGARVRDPESLTEVEVWTRNSPTIRFPMADGHAGNYDERWLETIIDRLPEIKRQAGRYRDQETEQIYTQKFWALFKQQAALDAVPNYKILPSASFSIDVATSVFKRRGDRVLLGEPCFDNLHHYCKERGVPVKPLPEEALRTYGVDAIDFRKFDVLFLTSPNNPTGYTLDEGTFQTIAEECARNRKTLALDASFRAYDDTGVDHYKVVKGAGCSFIIIEDSGKTWPTMEMKASIIACSNDLKQDLNSIAEIHALGWSRPILLFLAELIDVFQELGLEQALHHRVRESREILRSALRGTLLRPSPSAFNSKLPLEWIEILDDRYDDVGLMNLLAKRGLGVLPGNHFFFSSKKENSRHLRFSLLKERKLVEGGAQLLRETILSLD